MIERRPAEKKPNIFRPRLLDMFQAESDTGVLLTNVNGEKARTKPHTGTKHAVESRPHHHRSHSDRPRTSHREEEERRDRKRERRKEAEAADQAAIKEYRHKKREAREAEAKALEARENRREKERLYHKEKPREPILGGQRLRESFAKGMRSLFT